MFLVFKNFVYKRFLLIFIRLGGHVHIFPFQKGPLDPCFPSRDDKSYVEDCKNASNKENSHGVNGKTVLSKLKYFKPTVCTNIDYMHSILEGVMKRFFKYWFEETVRDTDKYKFSLKHHAEEINRRLLNIRVPTFIPVTPRSIHDFKLWRAKEFLSFLIYYLLPIFYDLMEPIYLINITKLVVAMEFLLRRKIFKSELKYVKNILIDVKEVEEIYPPHIMLSGMHEILHLVDCTFCLGPLNCVCCFLYEEINRKIVNLIHSNDLIGTEFLLNFSVLQSLEVFCESNNTNNPVFNEFINKHNIIRTSNKKRINEEKCILGPLISLTDQFELISNKIDLNGIDRSEI